MAERRPRIFWRFVREWLLPQKSWLLLGVLFSAITAVAAISYAEITTRAVDWLQAHDWQVVTTAPFLIVGAVIVRSVSLYIQTQAFNFGVQRAMVQLQKALFASLIDGDFARLQSEKSGEYVSRFANDMNLIREASLRVATNATRSVFTIVACLAFMFWKDWPLALLLLVVYPIAFIPVIKLGDRIRKTSKVAQEQVGELTANLSEAFQGARTVKAYGLEGYQKERTGDGFVERARLYMKILRSKALVDPILEVMGGLALAGLFAFAGWRAINGESSVGELIGFITAIGIASPEVRALGTLNAVTNEGMAAADRLYQVIDEPQAIGTSETAVPVARGEGAVSFRDVVFGYDADQPVLNGLSFDAKPGQMVALVGASGAGKSTVLNLLLRLYDVDGGGAFVDGTDVRNLELSVVRRQFALVSQDAFLFDASLRENVRVGRPNATDVEIESAVKAAACGFVETLPMGLDSPAGESGRNLSGGQKQRIALARALLSDAPVLLLDEATSALDSESEASVQETLLGLAGSRTIVVIAHRLATVRRADVIYVLDAGQVVESGKHDELLDAGGHYADLVRLQLR